MGAPIWKGVEWVPCPTNWHRFDVYSMYKLMGLKPALSHVRDDKYASDAFLNTNDHIIAIKICHVLNSVHKLWRVRTLHSVSTKNMPTLYEIPVSVEPGWEFCSLTLDSGES